MTHSENILLVRVMLLKHGQQKLVGTAAAVLYKRKSQSNGKCHTLQKFDCLFSLCRYVIRAATAAELKVYFH